MVNGLELFNKIKVKILTNGFMETFPDGSRVKHWDAESLGDSFKGHLIIAVEKLPDSSEIEIEIRRNVRVRRDG